MLHAMAEMDELNAWVFLVQKEPKSSAQLHIHHLQNSVGELSGGQRKRVANLQKHSIDIGFDRGTSLLMMDETDQPPRCGND